MDPMTLMHIKTEIRENMSPYFDDTDIVYYYEKNGRDINATIHELLIVKSEDSTISVSGLSTGDTSAYFRMLRWRSQRFNSGVLQSD